MRPYQPLGRGFLHFPFDVAAAEEGGVYQIHADEAVEYIAVDAEMLGLAAHRRFPVKSEPVQILLHGGFEFGRAAFAVDILHAQQKPPAGRLRHLPVEQGGIGMAEMQVAIGTGSKAENRDSHELGFLREDLVD